MNSKSTWVWLTIAAILFAAVFGVEKYWRKPPPVLQPLLPNFRAAAITSVQYTPAGQLEIRADRTNGQWQITKPITYPAQATSIETLLNALQQIAPMQTISGAELRQHPKADEEFGFQNRRTLTLQTENDMRPIYLGNRTAPGDGVYVQIVGGESVFVVDAHLLELLPTKPDDWRNTALVDLPHLTFDRLSVSNAAAVVQLVQVATNLPWRLVFPIPARADNERLITSLQQLHTTRVKQFVTDNPAADLESFGFQTPELELALARGTNPIVTLQFGKSPTNDSTLIYARRVGLPSIFTVERQALKPWLIPLDAFRDPHLLTQIPALAEVEVGGQEPFTLQLGASTNGWQLKDSTLTLDQEWVNAFLLTLRTVTIQHYKDSITGDDLPRYGLAEPQRTIRLFHRPGTDSTNTLFAELAFGTPMTNGLIFVRRADENPVYAINNADYGRLALAGWQLRTRQLWRFSETNTVRMVLQRGERKLDLRRASVNAWASIPPSRAINGSEVENIVKKFGALDASLWIARGEANRAALGFDTNSLSVSIEMKDGTRHDVEFGAPTPDGYPIAAVKLEGETWFFEFPLMTYKFMELALLNPAAFPP